MRELGAAALLALGAILAAEAPLLAEEPLDPICRLLLHEEQLERDDLALAVDLARSELVAAEEIFTLLDGLWKNEAVERLIYLTGKHDRDVAKLDVERAQLLLERQETLLEQYRLLCAELSTGKTSEAQQSSIAEGYVRYRRADCDALARDVAIAEVDLAYGREVLASVVDLRENGVATRQDVIIAERDVEMTQKRLAQAKQRVQRCRRQIDELRGASPE